MNRVVFLIVMFCIIVVAMETNKMAEQPGDQFLLPCSICSRTFRPEILERHEKVCEKTISKKRKVFDSFKCRVHGTDLEEFLGPSPLPAQQIKQPKPKPVVKKPPKWRQTHENLIATLRAVRGQETTSSTTTATTKTPSLSPDIEQCPTCGRKFGPRAYDRHVEFCREVMSRKPKTPVKNPAQQRMEARIKYRAPLVLKKSRQNNVPPSQPNQTYRANSNSSTTTLRSPSTQNPPSSAIIRSTASRTSLRVRNTTSAKLPEQSKTRRVSSPAKLPTIKNVKAAKSDSASSSDGSRTYSTTMQEITAAAEQQMRDLLSWPSDSNLSTQMKPIHPRAKNSSNSSGIQVSPTSAFTPVVKNEDLSFVSLADDLPIGTSTPKTPQTVRKIEYDENGRRHSVVSVSSHSTLADEGVVWANLETMFGNNKKNRTKMLARSKSVFEDRNRMLFLQTYDPDLTSSEDDIDKKRDNNIVEQPSFLTYADTCPSVRPSYTTDDEVPTMNKEVIHAGGDSAYSSLNRQEKCDKEMAPTRKVSKFCHECGSKFPIALAKFCCECGIRRLLI